MVDTDAVTNAIDEFKLNCLCNKANLMRLDKPFYGFGNPNKPLETLGYCRLLLAWRGKIEEITFILVKGHHQNLIDRRTAEVFGMVTLYLEPEPETKLSLNQIYEKIILSKEELALEFPRFFSGKLGCIKGVEVKLDEDKTVKSVKQPLRPIAFYYRDAVEKKLEKQVREDILERVDVQRNPITLISNLVIVPKDRKPGASNGKISKPNQPETEQQYEFAIRLTCDSR